MDFLGAAKICNILAKISISAEWKMTSDITVEAKTRYICDFLKLNWKKYPFLKNQLELLFWGSSKISISLGQNQAFF